MQLAKSHQQDDMKPCYDTYSLRQLSDILYVTILSKMHNCNFCGPRSGANSMAGLPKDATLLLIKSYAEHRTEVGKDDNFSTRLVLTS